MKSICFSNFSCNHISSLSKKAIYLPLASLIPILRGMDGEPEGSFVFKYLIRKSFASYFFSNLFIKKTNTETCIPEIAKRWFIPSFL